MRILVCTKADLPSAIALNRLLPALEGHAVEVLLTEKTRSVERTLPELGVLKFLERDLPFKIVFPLLERSGRSEADPRLQTFAELSRTQAIRITTIGSINDGDGFALARSFDPDLVISSRFSLVFKGPMLRLPRHGILNLHPGPLPGYGGLFVIFRQMLAGCCEIGITLHKVDEGIDTGPVVTIRPMKIEPGRSMLWHVLRTYHVGVESIVAAVATLQADGELQAVPQDPSRMRYFHLPGRALFGEFAMAGHKLYDLEEYAEDLRLFFGTDCGPGADDGAAQTRW